MLVVIFGAGASYDSLDERHLHLTKRPGPRGWRPPLASELFELRPDTFGPVMSTFRTGQATFMELQRAIQRGELIEDAIESFMGRNVGPLGQRQLAAVLFYLQEILWKAGETWNEAAFGQTNYAYLVDVIEKWRDATEQSVSYATFNYDLMLEYALRPMYGLTEFASYIGGPMSLIKLHGSVNWGQLAPKDISERSGDLRSVLVDEAPSLFAHRAGWGLFRQFNSSTDETGKHAMYPAMALPTRGKGGFTCPPDHLQTLERSIQAMDRLLVIGWRGQEQHLLDLLAKCPNAVRTHVVTSKPESALSLAKLLEHAVPGADVEPFGEGFSGYVYNDDVKTLLT